MPSFSSIKPDIHPIAYVFLSIGLRAVNQVLIKKLGILSQFELFTLSNALLFSGLLCILVLRAAAWQKALAHFPLSYAYPLTSLIIPMIVVSGALFFSEPLSLGDIAGSILILSGVLLITTDNTLNTIR